MDTSLYDFLGLDILSPVAISGSLVKMVRDLCDRAKELKQLLH